MLKKNNRLKKRKEFNYIYKKGQVAHGYSFTIHYVRAYKPYAQIGITVGKTVGNSVVRSRVKRIISEACRLNIDKFAIKNYIITAKPEIVDKKSTDIETELMKVLKKNNLLKGADGGEGKPQLKSNNNIKSEQRFNDGKNVYTRVRVQNKDNQGKAQPKHKNASNGESNV